MASALSMQNGFSTWPRQARRQPRHAYMLLILQLSFSHEHTGYIFRYQSLISFYLIALSVIFQSHLTEVLQRTRYNEEQKQEAFPQKITLLDFVFHEIKKGGKFRFRHKKWRNFSIRFYIAKLLLLSFNKTRHPPIEFVTAYLRVLAPHDAIPMLL